ncbi:Plant transposon protein [Seminavis robusta]|uniref:Plant transposon protein n=1 Tax=Seminavis robusta TaxID=568900 RepID=A0A9N8EVL4_9STRA|nr:Plant transposon protein [Seminavis robusta]|eukprot:Sro1741_g294630.1 Plant transposon protein (556) ;mRNA; r:5660-7327
MEVDNDLPLLEEDEISLCDCIDNDGNINLEKYRLYMSQEDDKEDLEESKLQSFYMEDSDSEGETTKATRGSSTSRKRRTVKSIKPYYFDSEGNKVTLVPKQTVWYLMYVVSPALDCPKFMKKFRRRFRLPYSEYLDLLETTESNDMFRRWRSKDATGKESSPLQLLVLGALRYLGRGLTFDDLEEYTAINEETHRQFFHVFIQFGEEVLYPLYVTMPRTAQELKSHRKEFDIGGLYGCGWSSDATNVVMWRCSHNLKQANTGFKQSHPARTYNLTCNHRREILHTTKGHPSRWNDKTLVLFDDFITGIHENRILQDVKFHLFSWSGEVGNSQVEYTNYSGAWGLVDNGYHRWACTQAPAKMSFLRSEQRLSEWIESFRKDAECTFGILKGRFRILRTGIRLDGPEAADRIWLTCCALHNKLLKADGLLDEWEGARGENDVDDMRRFAPFALQRLNDNQLRSFGGREHERECIDEETRRRATNSLRGEEEESAQEEEDLHEDDDYLAGQPQQYAIDGSILVNSLSYDDFRNRLVEHFDILWRRHRVKWPERKISNN